jgi:hypothetical protein
MGWRGSASPVENTTVYGELAYQWGDLGVDLDEGVTDGAARRPGDVHQAWLTNLGLELMLANLAMSPKVGLEWLFKSGEDKDQALSGWDPIAPSYFPTLVRSYQLRSTLATSGLPFVDQPGVTSAFTNQHDLALYGSLKPIEDLTVDARLSWFVEDVGSKGAAGQDSARHKFLGTEFDKRWTYQYTDDVTLSVAWGIFWPGSTFRSSAGAAPVRADNTSQILLTEASLKF